MNRFHRATLALITAAALGFSGPLATANVGHNVPSEDKEYRYDFINGSTFSGTATYGGVTITFNVTVNSCGSDGDDCRKTPTGYEPR
jgi:hypothetical protein